MSVTQKETICVVASPGLVPAGKKRPVNVYSSRRNKRPLPMALTSPGLRILVISGSDTDPTHSNHHLTLTLVSVDGDVRVVVLDQTLNPSHSRHCFHLCRPCVSVFFVTRRLSVRDEKSDDHVTHCWCGVNMTYEH